MEVSFIAAFCTLSLGCLLPLIPAARSSHPPLSVCCGFLHQMLIEWSILYVDLNLSQETDFCLCKGRSPELVESEIDPVQHEDRIMT